MTGVVGFIGVGNFAAYLVEALRRTDPGPEIILSPRNAARAQQLSIRFGARVAADNQSVADAADIVFLTTPGAITPAVVEAVDWRSGQRVVTMAAGVRLGALRDSATPALVIRAMANSSAVLGESPTFLYPGDVSVAAVLASFGPRYDMPDEATFEVAEVLYVCYAWLHVLMAEVHGWATANGLEAGTAHDIIASTLRSAAGMSSWRGENGYPEVIDSLVTPGGTTELGLEIMAETDVFGTWRRAMDAVLVRMRGGGSD